MCAYNYSYDISSAVKSNTMSTPTASTLSTTSNKKIKLLTFRARNGSGVKQKPKSTKKVTWGDIVISEVAADSRDGELVQRVSDSSVVDPNRPSNVSLANSEVSVYRPLDTIRIGEEKTEQLPQL